MPYEHIPVLAKEVLTSLNPQPGEVFVDATLGLGGHARQILAATAPTGRLLGIERSQVGANQAQKNLVEFAERVEIVVGDFRDLAAYANRYGFNNVDGILFDLGLASWQIDLGHQGLSFQIDAPLDMRLVETDPQAHARLNDDPSLWTENKKLAHLVRTWRFKPAEMFINQASAAELELVARELGGVRKALTVSQAIANYRQSRSITTTKDLVSAIGSESPKLLAPFFQSLRILVNDEYGALAVALPAAWNLLASAGRLAVISFHSGEHRLVKNIFRTIAPGVKITKLAPTEQENNENPRARSAQLRTITKEINETDSTH